MATALISDKFRIFNAAQFLESLNEADGVATAPESGEESGSPVAGRTSLYFFVGRSKTWYAQIEINAINGTPFAVGDTVTSGATTWTGTVAEVYGSDSILVSGVTDPVITPGAGATITGAPSGATAEVVTYRFATDEAPPAPVDNLDEKFTAYDEMIAAKRIVNNSTDISKQFARAVVRRYNWNLAVNNKYDMWKPDYYASGDGQIGRSPAVSDKYYVLNRQFEVFKCLYNGQSAAFPTGQTITDEQHEPSTTPSVGSYNATTGIYRSPQGYIWKFMYLIPTNDVLKFLSSDFMPISATASVTIEDGAIEVIVDEGVGGLPTQILGPPANTTYYAAIRGDGTGGVAAITIDGSGNVLSITTDPDVDPIASKGTGYTYASVPLVDGAVAADGGAIGLFQGTPGSSAAAGVISVPRDGLDPIISPQGGHNANLLQELNAKRVMTNIRLTYAEGIGDFPVDNDFRRIGLIKDPYNFGTTTVATADTLSALNTICVDTTGSTDEYQVDEVIEQTTAGGGIARGTIVSITPSLENTELRYIKYYQDPKIHAVEGVVTPFDDSNNISNITGQTTGTSFPTTGAGDGTFNTDNELEDPDRTDLGTTITDGVAAPEIERGSGEIIYLENRRLITRASDQIEDIKLVIEF